MSNSDYKGVSICKAIGILLMVWGHAGAPEIFVRFLSIFHMPLFFIMSGFCFKDKYITEPMNFVKKRLLCIYIPYVKYSLLFLLLHNLFFILNIYNNQYGFNGEVGQAYSWKEMIYRILRIMTKMQCHDQLLGGYWFMKELLLSSIIGFFALKYLKNIGVILFLLFVLTFIFSRFQVAVPFINITQRTLMATLFFILGVYYKKSEFCRSIGWTVFFFICVVIIAFLRPISISFFLPMDVFPYALCAFVGTIAVFNISKSISSTQTYLSELLVFIGNNTFVILTWHFLCFKFITLLRIIVFHEDVSKLGYFPIMPPVNWWCLAYFTVGILFPISIAYINYKIRLCHNESKL